MTETAFVEFDQVQKSYDGETLAVANLNLSIPRGEFMTLLGPSGSGKTSSLMMLAGFETVTHGEIRLDGRSVNSVPPHQLGIGVVFQNYALFPHMTVNENLAFPLQVRRMGRSEVEERVRDALQMVEMERFGNRRPSELSGGQQQRAALARALVFRPELVLMDEPLGALDRQLREHMQYEIKHLHDQLGVTVVYVTHDQSEALTMSTRIAVFKDGSIQQDSDPETLYECPETAFVARFIGENNRLYGRVERVSDGVAEVSIEDSGQGRALAINCSGVGTPTTLSIRPERVFIGDMGENQFDAVVEELIYLGDHIRCRMRVLGHDDFIVKMPNAAGHEHLKVGQKTPVSWNTEDCRALDALP